MSTSNCIQFFIAMILAITTYLQYRAYKIQQNLYVPNIEAGLSEHEEHKGFFFIVIKNTGSVSAYNIKLSPEPDLKFHCTPDAKTKPLSEHSVFRKGIATLLPIQHFPLSKCEFFLGTQFKKNDSYISFDMKFNINITYQDKSGKKYSNKSTISFEERADISWLGKLKGKE